MHACMFNSSNILVYRKPSVCNIVIKRRFIVMSVSISCIIPRTASKSIHSVGFSFCFSSAFRTSCIDKRIGFFKRIFSNGKFYIHRKSYRQIGFFNGNYSAFFTMNERQRISPISLS